MEESGRAVEEELELAQRLKAKFCDKSGKEANTAETAQLIHKIGLLHRKRTPDKISLIQSVGLLNAAIVRNPANTDQIKSDLAEINQQILQQAKAENQEANLIEKSNQLSASFTELRKDVAKYLRKFEPKITKSKGAKLNFETIKSRETAAMQKLNKMIADKYKLIMADLCQFCQNVMGKPPCEYTVVGMGSLARQEITPYSDFEHLILLCNDILLPDKKWLESHLEYFRWYSVLFHVIILNMQETIIPSLDIFSLNSSKSKLGNWFYDAFTPRGISFDGLMPHACKFPLGNQALNPEKPFTTELIKPVSKMLEYLSSEADLKYGYHLADILTRTCYVFGNEDIFKQFQVGVENHRNKLSKADNIRDLQKQTHTDLHNFSTRFRLINLKNQDTINIKQVVYRSTTLFISALARIHNISANSCFDAITDMAEQNIYTENTANKLKSAIATACEIRLRAYMENKSQFDNAIDLKKDGIEKFLNIVGVASTVNYFQIAYCLQREVAKQLDFTKLHFYSDPQLVNISIGLAFGIKDLVKFDKNQSMQDWDLKNFDFDKCIEQLETAVNFSEIKFQKNQNVSTSSSNPPPTTSTTEHEINTDQETDTEQIKSIADYLKSARVFDEAVDFYEQLLHIYQSKADNRDYDVAITHQEIAFCCHRLNQNTKALAHLEKALAIYQNITSNAAEDRNIATVFTYIGHCYRDMQKYDEAMKKLNRAVKIEQNTTLNADADRDIAWTLHVIGSCHIEMQQYVIALEKLNRALEIEQNTALNPDTDRNLAATLHSIGRCHIEMQQYDIALEKLNRALEIKQNTTLNADTDRNLAWTLHDIGRCHIEMQQHDIALEKLTRALEIQQNTALNPDTDRNLASTLHVIGSCHNGMQQYDIALEKLKRALKIKQMTALNPDTDADLAITQRSVDECVAALQQQDTA